MITDNPAVRRHRRQAPKGIPGDGHPRPAGVLLKTLLPVVGAAVAGNAFVSRDSLKWFQDLRRPALQLPMAGFYTVGGVYYVLMGVVVHRSIVRSDARSYRLAMAVLAGNEVWNAGFFGRRSTRNGFLGVLAFLLPLGLLQVSVAGDRTSTLALAPYTAYVLGYDLPWTYQLWRLNPAPPSGDGPRPQGG